MTTEATLPTTTPNARSERLLGVVYLVLGVLFNVGGQLLLKQAALGGLADGAISRSIFSIWFIAGGASLGLSMLVWIATLRRMPLNLAHPLSIGFALVLVALSSRLIWGEPMPLTRLVGIGIILAGVVLVARDMK